MRSRLPFALLFTSLVVVAAGLVWWRTLHALPEFGHAAPLGQIGALVPEVDVGWFARTLGDSAGADASCRECHADLVPKSGGHDQLACTSCHGSESIFTVPGVEPVREGAAAPHPVQPSPEFAGPALCAGCHPDSGAVDATGKREVETIEEWRRSLAASTGKTCHSCHMPGGAHDLGGLNTPAFVAQGFTAAAKFISDGNRMVGKFQVQATEVGHRFPSRSGVEFGLSVAQVDAGGLVLEGTEVEGVIGRRLTAAGTELFDTRLRSGEEKTMQYERALNPDAVAMVARIVVLKPENIVETLLFEQRVELPGNGD